MYATFRVRGLEETQYAEHALRRATWNDWF